ncbi:zinc knuckle domain-containing protein [Trichoderma breve]|uniref:Zinc knuckle domain-containing protein n=1 Tax=Trichoderma breve TaxID=2034170 RepID=A0A9W9EBP8_9HYPO|nr:zinc knuckle domain-containing protein [Trichoderma breve]KAJ4863787.1 zinc knuckle domain-containing protein [Trichoderma breve]
MLETRYVPATYFLMKLCELTCLARHYSYECKSSTQERPYVSRPSRSQQLRNPKLVPKLTSDTPNPLEKKKGVADEELAKIEAERERKRELEEREDELLDAETLALRRPGEELAEARHLRDESGVQYHAIAHLLRVRISREEIEVAGDSPLMAGKTMFHPLGSASVTRSPGDATAGGEAGQIHDRDHHSQMIGRIEGEMKTAPNVAAVAAGVVEGKEEHRPERHPESEVSAPLASD